MYQFFPFALQHPGDRNAGPACHYGGNVFCIHFFLDQWLVVLLDFQLFLQGRDGQFCLLGFAIADFCHKPVISLSLCLVGLCFQLLDLLFLCLNSLNQRFLGLPGSPEFFLLLLEVGNLLFQTGEFGFVVLALDGSPFDL